ncbi:MAG: DUF1653 domain-containing protein [Lachnospiraceae bacterium]|nr:DUF1653 domain-containing protein [Lachnospiraceae bacterium]MBR4807673.1 DUF1653 domain-containing protein [Lachnospiraceae bacterium]
MERRVEVGQVYRHFKGNVYEVVALAVNADNREEVVVYRALNRDKVFVRSYRGFVSEVNKEKYPDVTQKYRFELVSDKEPEEAEEPEELADIEAESDEPADKGYFPGYNGSTKKAPAVGEVKAEEPAAAPEGDVNPMLMQFLETKSFDEKLQILRRMESEMTDKLLDDMAASLDVVIHDGELSDRIRELKTCLSTFNKFDCKDRFNRDRD